MANDQRERRLAWDGCLNARDLGGYATADGRETRWGRVVRSASLEALTPAGQDALAAYGVRTVVDLRSADELAAFPNPFAADEEAKRHGIAYIHAPLVDPAAGDPPPFTTLADLYAGMFDRFACQIAGVMTTIAGAAEGGVLVHCRAGKDRTGLICALLLDLARVDRATIAADYALNAECLREQELDYVENGPGDRAEREKILTVYAPTAAVMTETLDRLAARHGGAEPYLLQAGVSTGEIAALRERLLGSGDGGA